MYKFFSMRWIILCLGMGGMFAQGIAYASSVIRDPLLLMVGIADKPDVLKTHWATVFTLTLVFLPLGMIIAGRLTDKKGPRIPISMGAMIFASGLILTSFATSYIFLCFTFGFMLSFGSGLAYGPIVASAVRWFPDRRGLVSGIVVGANGLGPVLIAPFCGIMLNTFHYDITTVLRCLGLFTLIAMGAAAFITSPPNDFQGTTLKSDTNQKSTTQNSDREVSWRGMIVTADFWMLFLFFVLGTMPGMMLISQASAIFISLGEFEAVTAALLVAVLAAANAIGRVLCGTISDYLGRLNTLMIIFACSSIAMFTFPFATNSLILIAVIILVGITYGGTLGLIPSFCADSFGLKNMTLNYAVLIIAFAVTAIVGPQIYGLMTNPKHAFFTAGSLALLGCIGTVFYRKRNIVGVSVDIMPA